jgi:tetratricopeptide (TPR) repeat protein
MLTLVDEERMGGETMVATRLGRRRLVWAAAATGCQLLVLAQTHAAGRYGKKEVEIQATQTSLTKSQKGAAAGKQGPSLQADLFIRGVESKVAELRDRQITVLRKLISATSDRDPDKPDLFFRLAELFAEKQRYYNFKAGELDQRIFAAPPGRQGSLQAEQRRYRDEEKKWLLQAVATYINLVDGPQYQKYKKMDEVLFYLAYMLNQVQRQDKARLFFARLIRDFPTSKFIPDALLSFGEFYFQSGDMDNALKFYDRVLKFRQSKVYGFALYKTAWCYYNLVEYRRALEVFHDVIKYAQQLGGRDKLAGSLEREAKRDSVLAYSHIGTAEKAWPFFQRVGGTYAPKMLERLGEIYTEQGKFADAVKIYRQLIALDPNDDRVCLWQGEIVKATLPGSKREQVTELQRLAAVYDKLRAKGKTNPASLLEECKDTTAGTLRELATVWHKEAQKTQNNDTYALAQYLYREYIDKFPNEKDSYMMAFYYGELLFKIERWKEAAEVYTRVVKMDPKGKFVQDAAYAAVISWKNALNVDDSGQGAKREQRKDDKQNFRPLPIPEAQQKMIEAFDTYIKYVPRAGNDQLVNIKYRKARVFYEYNHFDQAIPLFEDIVTNHTEHELAVYAANLLLDCFNILGRYEDIEKYVARFVKMPALMKDPEFGKQMKDIQDGVEGKVAERAEKQGKFKECGERFREIAERNPNNPKLAQILYNSALCFEKARLVGAAINARIDLIKAAPTDPLAQKALLQVGQNFHAIAYYTKAAEFYEKFAEKFGGEKDAADALSNATFFRRGLGDNEQAVNDSKLYIKQYGGSKPAEAARVFFSIGTIFETAQRWGELEKHIKQYLSQWARKGGADLEILAYVKLGELYWRQSCPVRGIQGACIEVAYKRSGGRAERRRAKNARQCGPETKKRITVVERKSQSAGQAMAAMAKALALYGKGRAVARIGVKDEAQRAQRQMDLVYAVAQARFYQGERAYERFLSIKFPDKLNFDPKNPARAKESTKAFQRWLAEKTKLLQFARDIYSEVITFQQAHWAIASAARIGQLFQNFADGLFTAPVPSNLTEDQRDVYCDTLQDKADPLESKAIEGFSVCQKKSTELSWFNDWSQLCETELNQIKPAEYPLASEIRAQPGQVALDLDRAPIASEIQSP